MFERFSHTKFGVFHLCLMSFSTVLASINFAVGDEPSKMKCDLLWFYCWFPFKTPEVDPPAPWYEMMPWSSRSLHREFHTFKTKVFSLFILSLEAWNFLFKYKKSFIVYFHKNYRCCQLFRYLLIVSNSKAIWKTIYSLSFNIATWFHNAPLYHH